MKILKLKDEFLMVIKLQWEFLNQLLLLDYDLS